MTITPLQTERLFTRVTQQPDELLIVLAGTADLEARQPLVAWVAQLHQAARQAESRRVVLDLRELEFMSSICVNVLVGWLVTIMELSPAEQYGVHLHWDRRQLWQRRSVHALRRFAPRIVTTEP
jgi:anti-anti-sigma factor